MSYQAVDAVLAHSKAIGSDRLVLLVIASHASKDMFECHPGHKLLCQGAAMSERNLIRCLNRLAETGEITVNRGTGRGNLTSYQINLQAVKRVTTATSFTAPERVTNPVERMTDTTPFIEPERVTESAERVTPDAIKGDKTVGAYKDIEPEETNKKPERERALPVDEIAAALCDLYRIPDGAGWRLRDKFQYLAIELNGIGATVIDVKSFYTSRQKKPGVEFFVGDFVAWRASQNENGLPPKKQNAGAYVGRNKPTEEPMNDTEIDEFVDVAIRANDLVYLAKERDRIIKRGGAVHERERKILAFFEQPIAGNEPVTPAEMADMQNRIAVAKEKTRLREISNG